MKILTQEKGFTLVELLVAVAVLAISIGITFTSIMGVRFKAILQSDSDEVLRMLEFAREQSVAAYRGESYSLSVDPNTKKLQVTPGNQPRYLHNSVSIEITPNTNQITFSKLKGETDQTYSIAITQGNLVSIIKVEESGLITQETISAK